MRCVSSCCANVPKNVVGAILICIEPLTPKHIPALLHWTRCDHEDLFFEDLADSEHFILGAIEEPQSKGHTCRRGVAQPQDPGEAWEASGRQPVELAWPSMIEIELMKPYAEAVSQMWGSVARHWVLQS